ncbi:MAG: hypothetical protein GXP54_00695 [Deltaproteobacteria bacterium]|nr:hypothetical protein [Deltaproteobacteria bacterium]
MIPCAVLMAALSLFPSCKDKEPYSGNKGRAVVRGPWGRAAPPGVPAEPMPVAVILTPDGSIMVTSRPGGRDLDISKVPVQAYVREDGTMVAFRTQIEKKKGTAQKESVFTTLFLEDDGNTRKLFPGEGQARPDLEELGKADPDLARLYYHREAVSLLGVSGSIFSWIISIDGYLGGAHPYAQRRLLAVDAQTGAPVDVKSRYSGYDPGREGRLGLGSEDCLTRFQGVAPVDWIGGDATWLAFFTNEFESCSGGYRLVKVAPPSSAVHDGPGEKVRASKGVFEIPEEKLRVKGVVDWRASADGDVAVMLMALGRRDGLKPPWLKGGTYRPDRRTREMRVWIKGMDAPAVAGRATRILSVQFLNGHSYPGAVLASFKELESRP